MEIRTITDEADGVIFTGTVISSEVRELRSKKKLLLMRLADDSNGIPCKKFFDHPEDAEGGGVTGTRHCGEGARQRTLWTSTPKV